MNLKEIEKQYGEGNVNITFMLEGLVDQFEKDKTSLDIQQLQLLCEYLIKYRRR